MLKHVRNSSTRASLLRSPQKADTLSIASATSLGSLHDSTLSSRSSSCTSLNETHGSLGSSGSSSSSSNSSSVQRPPATTAVKVYTRCLRPDLEYRTLSVEPGVTCRQVIARLLNKYRMKHRDPNLFYLTMEIGTKQADTPVRTILVLDDDSCPAQLQDCYPRGNARFTVRMRQGGLIKVYNSVLMQECKYKSLLISERTTCSQLIQLLLNCYTSEESVSAFCLHEVCHTMCCERTLLDEECPLLVQQKWLPGVSYSLVLRRRPPVTPRPWRDPTRPGHHSLRRSYLRWSQSQTELSRSQTELNRRDSAIESPGPEERRPRSPREFRLGRLPLSIYSSCSEKQLFI